MSLDDWILALHVLSAFSLVAGLITFWVLIAVGWNADTPEALLRAGGASKVAAALVGAGSLGTIVLGIWLALSFGGYDIWDGWIIAAIILWALAIGFGQRGGVEYNRAVTKALELQTSGQRGPSAELTALNRTSKGLLLQTLSSALVLLILIDMIWKPGV